MNIDETPVKLNSNAAILRGMQYTAKIKCPCLDNDFIVLHFKTSAKEVIFCSVFFHSPVAGSEVICMCYRSHLIFLMMQT